MCLQQYPDVLAGDCTSAFKVSVMNCSVLTCIHLETVMKILICSTKIRFTLPEAFASYTLTLKCDSGLLCSDILELPNVTVNNDYWEMKEICLTVSHLVTSSTCLDLSVTVDCFCKNLYWL
jgi:hypothetical protein